MTAGALDMEFLVDVLLIIHVLAGVVGLLTALIAASNRKGSKIHRQVGTVFFWSMLVIGLTAIPVTFFRPNPFLFFIALFSFYMAFAGYRRGRSRYSPKKLDVVVAVAMMVTGLVMMGFGVLMLRDGSGLGSALIAFGTLGASFGVVDTREYWLTRTHSEKIQVHLSRMLGGTIATITAVLVQQVTPLVQAEWAQVLLWLGPTILLTPLIIVWQIRIRQTGKYRLFAPAPERKAA